MDVYIVMFAVGTQNFNIEAVFANSIDAARYAIELRRSLSCDEPWQYTVQAFEARESIDGEQ